MKIIIKFTPDRHNMQGLKKFPTVHIYCLRERFIDGALLSMLLLQGIVGKLYRLPFIQHWSSVSWTTAKGKEALKHISLAIREFKQFLS